MNFLATKSQLEMEFTPQAGEVAEVRRGKSIGDGNSILPLDNQNPIGVESVSAVNKNPIGGKNFDGFKF